MITFEELKKGGVRYTRVEPLGAVFEKTRDQSGLPAWSYGPKKLPMYQCPVTAIPPECFELLVVWQQCQALNALPYAGGVLDQPVSVRKYFPVFYDEYQRIEANQRSAGLSEVAMQSAAVAIRAMMGGGG